MNVETPDGKVIEFPDGMKNEEINAILDKQYAKPKSLGTKIAGAVDPYTRYALPVLGAIGGGVFGAPGNIIAPGVAEALGIGLGTLGGQQLANWIGQQAGRRGGFNLAELIKSDIPEAGINAAAPSLVNKVLPYIAKAGEKLYGNAISTPITKKWTKLFPGQEGTARETAVKLGYENDIYPTNFGIKTAAHNEAELRSAVNQIVDKGTAAGDIVSRYDLIKKGLGGAYGKAKFGEPEAQEVVDKLANRIRNIGNPGEMTTRDLLDLKRQLYTETTYEGKAISTATEKQFSELGKRGVARAAMLQLEDTYPQLKYLNKTESAYINLQEALERTVAKHEQAIQPSSKGIWLALKNLPVAVLEETFNHPVLKSRLAFALRNAAQRQGAITKPLIYGANAALEGDGEHIPSLNFATEAHAEETKLEEDQKKAEEALKYTGVQKESMTQQAVDAIKKRKKEQEDILKEK